jgi:ribosomal protein S18 acetylase RimI-like enzyme
MPDAFRVRRAVTGDEALLRTVRLEALAESPEAFASTYERELARTTADWQRWLTPGATFIAEAGGVPRGLVASALDQADPSLVNLMAMWVHPALRRTGAADALVASVADWAACQHAREVRLFVTKANQRAQRFYVRSGFQLTGHETIREKDGLVDLEMRRPVPARS